jgi:hypothetical protein
VFAEAVGSQLGNVLQVTRRMYDVDGTLVNYIQLRDSVVKERYTHFALCLGSA